MWCMQSKEYAAAFKDQLNSWLLLLMSKHHMRDLTVALVCTQYASGQSNAF